MRVTKTEPLFGKIQTSPTMIVPIIKGMNLRYFFFAFETRRLD